MAHKFSLQNRALYGAHGDEKGKNESGNFRRSF